MIPLSAAVIGLGKIGQEYDYDCTEEHLILTHATGFSYHSAYELVAGVDPDTKKRKLFEEKFHCPAYATVKELLSLHQIEVFSIGVPTPYHFKVFQELIQSSPKAIICEKPIADQSRDAQRMCVEAQAQNTVLLVNYMRRFEPGVLELKKKIEQGVFGEIYKGTVWYSKGILNNGSHFIDLLTFLLGEVSDVEIIQKGRKWKEVDPEPDVKIQFGKTTVYFLAGREECFSSLEMELVGTQGKLCYKEGGNEIYYYSVSPDPVFSGYTIIDPKKEIIENDLHRYQWHVLEHLAQHIYNGIPLYSNGKTALNTLKIIEDITSLLEK